MSAQEQNILSDSLVKLQEELNTFSTVHHELKTAREKLIEAEQEWEKLTLEQQQTAQQLVGATRRAIDATQAVTSQAESLTGALIPLAKAIENVNFPMRLDKIDLAVSMQAATYATLQAITERNFSSLQERATKNEDCVLTLVKQGASTRKRQLVIITLSILILFGLIGAVICFVKWH